MTRNKKYNQHRKAPASLPTIRRLPSYLHVIRSAEQKGEQVISGTIIAEELDLEPIQVRKDLSVTGISGKPRVGYNVKELRQAIERFLNWDKENKAILVGAGHLGKALVRYEGFRQNGLNITCAFDSDPSIIHTAIDSIPVYDLNDLEKITEAKDACIAILTVPSAVAQTITDQLVAFGIKAIWNFTNIKLKVPSDVLLQKEDLSSGYAVISVHKKDPPSEE